MRKILLTLSMKKYLLIPLALFVISGCATAPKILNTLKQNPNFTPTETIEKLGKPTEIHQIPTNPPITHYLYGSREGDQVSVFFVNDKLYKYDFNSPVFNLDTYYDLGLISKEDYQWSYTQIKQEEYNKALIQAQEDGMAMQMFMGMQSLNLQQQQLNTLKKPTYTPTPITLPKSYGVYDKNYNKIGTLKEQQ